MPFSRFQGVAHLGRALAYPGENHLAGIAAGGNDAREFAARDDVEAGAHAGEQINDGEGGIRLHGVTHQDVVPAAGGLELSQRCGEGGAGIDIAGRAEFARDGL